MRETPRSSKGRLPGKAALLLCLLVCDSASAFQEVEEEAEVLANWKQELLEDWEFEAYIFPSYRFSDDLVYTFDPATFEDVGNLNEFGFETTSVSIKRKYEDFTFKLAYNPESSKFRSTYVRYAFTDWGRVTFGRFKATLLRSRLVSRTRTLFIERTIQARQTGPRDEGIKVEVDLGKRVQVLTCVQNGADKGAEDIYTSTRLVVEVLGGGVANYEGAYKSKDQAALTLGFGYANDNTFEEGNIRAADLAFTLRPFSLAAEVVDYDGDFGPYDLDLLDPVSIIERADTRPYSVTASWMIAPKKWEIAARHEEFDDKLNDTSRLTVGVNRYFDGHDLKWLLNWFKVRSDNSLLESDVVATGFLVRF